MDHNAGYVWTAYAVVAGTLTAYTAWLLARLRRAERSAADVAD
jgi:heme export protein D (CcmD)